MAVDTPELPMYLGQPIAAPTWRLVISRVMLSLGVAVMLWLANWLARSPRGVEVQRAEMAALPAGAALPQITAIPVVQWQPLDAATLATWTGPYLLRFHFVFTARDTAVPHAVSVSLRAAFRATWDGAPLTTNGRVGATADSEVPGRVDWTAPVPAVRGGVGVDELLLLASSHHQRATFSDADVRVLVAPLEAVATRSFRAWLLPLLALGALVYALWYVLVLIARSGTAREARGLFALGGAGFLLTAAEAWRPLIGYAYPLHAIRLRLVLLFTGLTMYLLVRYVHQRVGSEGASGIVTRRLVLLTPAILLVIAVASPTNDLAALLMHLVGTSFALFLIMRRREARQRMGSVATVLATTLVAIVLASSVYLDGLYLIALAALLLVVLYDHALFLRERAAHAHALESIRLRLTAALVHRSIQPHWLMNALTGLQELIEQDPARASRVVELLAEEFRTVSEISQRAWIGGEQELKLCQVHLAIVSQSLPTPRTLHVTGESLLSDIAIPPGVVHALLENGLTHAGTKAPSDSRDFSLMCTIDNTDFVMQFDAPLGRGGDSGRKGTGTRFVESSLEAAYPGRWQHTQGPEGGYWRVSIRIPVALARSARAHLERVA